MIAWRAAGLAVMATVLATQGRAADPALAGPGMTWESIRSLPDFSGWWQWVPAEVDTPRSPQGVALAPPQPMTTAPLRPEIVRPLLESALRLQNVTAGRQEERSLLDVAATCRPPRFNGINGTYGSKFEVLFTPGRVTVINEEGLVRRAALGVSMLSDPVPINAGTSVARWEGDVLVIETDGSGLERRGGPFILGTQFKAVERFRLVAPDELQVQLHLEAPEAFTRPFEKTLTYRRDHGHTFIDAVSCDPQDRSFDHATRRERFDVTPPPGLPPPPED